jgi:methylglutaconyl-CoA hydratase
MSEDDRLHRRREPARRGGDVADVCRDRSAAAAAGRRIHGAALGGGAGLAAVCDIVVADESAMFGFTEVKLGILPAVISPFALAKIGRARVSCF